MNIKTYQNPTQPQKPEITPQEILTPPSYFARVAAAAGFCSVFVFGSAAILLYRIGIPLHPIDLLLIVICLTALMAGGIGLYWTIRHQERPIKFYQDTITQLEDEITRLQALKITPAAANDPPIAFDAFRAGIDLLSRYYLKLPSARGTAGLTQTEHNNAVKLLRAIRLLTGEKKGVHLTTEDPAVIFSRLMEIKKIEPSRIWIKEGSGQISIPMER